MENFATINIRETNESKKVKIASDSKPELVDATLKKWQVLIDTLARIINVPSALIMRLNKDNIEVFLKSNTKGNPYKENEKVDLVYGLYCENVIGKQQQLIVPNAKKSKVWRKNNPDVDINMISYLGVPINWPDGECFGTVCVLDNKENKYSKDFAHLINQMKLHIELDLQTLLQNLELHELNEVKSKFLSLISHDIRGSISSSDEFLKLLIKQPKNKDYDDMLKMLDHLSVNLSQSRIALDNLLGWSKSVVKNIKPENSSFDLVIVMDELIKFFSLPVKLKELKIEKNYSSNPCEIFSDKNMLTMSIRNILSNAIKYSLKGGLVKISISKSKEEGVLIEIMDSGIGMNSNTKNRLFQYADSHQQQGTEGESSAGIGLILTKEFLDKIGATVSVDSEIDKGSTFTVCI
jgi:anti-sigma regulatory factor (Ser/Thr protein kinase)